VSVADVLEREEAWFLDATLGLPPLLASAGGPFDIVAAQVRRVAQGPRQLFLGVTESRETRPAKNSPMRLDHDVVALCLWSAVKGGARAHLDQAVFDDALSAVVARVRGPGDIGDATHGGRWWLVSDARVALPTLPQVLAFGDAVGALGAAYVRSVTWTVSEWV
jgi:hypothetical protein